MDQNLLDQRIQKLRGQFLRNTDLLDQLDPLLRVLDGLLFFRQFCFADPDLLFLFFLLLLVPLREHIEIAFR